MVKIKEIAEELDQMSGLFWGVAMQGGKRYSQKVVTPFHIAMAALEPGSAGDEDVGNGIVTVWLGIKGKRARGCCPLITMVFIITFLLLKLIL